jgi:hypothetical protein
MLWGFSTVGIFIIMIGIAYAISSDRYENVSIFSAPTPFVPMPVEQIVEPAVGIPVSDDEAIEIYAATLQTIQKDEFLSEIDYVAISRQTYPDPSSPGSSDKGDLAGFLLSGNISEGITVSAQELPFELIWVDDFEKSLQEDADKSEKPGDALILFGYLNPMKTGLIALNSTIYYQDNTRNLHFRLSNKNGPWQVIQYETDQESSPSSEINQPELQLTFEEMAKIYAAAVLQAYIIDNPKPEENVANIYLLQSTGLAVDSIRLSPEVQSGIDEALDHMPFDAQWVENRESISLSETDNSNGAGFAVVTFGTISSHDKNGATQVMIDVEFSSGDRILATYILEKIDGIWKITEFGSMG